MSSANLGLIGDFKLNAAGGPDGLRAAAAAAALGDDFIGDSSSVVGVGEPLLFSLDELDGLRVGDLGSDFLVVVVEDFFLPKKLVIDCLPLAIVALPLLAAFLRPAVFVIGKINYDYMCTRCVYVRHRRYLLLLILRC